ncbi:MAG: hypothetical protein PF448_03255 [Bacteroidales bacterium]|nr:hypothetical protein [Bacteroidales bacterium]
MIDKHNYEAFLLDFMEGNLSAEQAKALENFLQRHPEIDADIFTLDDVKLSPDSLRFDEKMRLKRDEDIPELSKQDALLIGLIENNLSPEERQTAEKLIQSDVEAANSFAQYQKTKLQPEADLLFPDKNKLKKKSPVILFSIRRVGAVAAVFIGILVTVFLNLNRFGNQYSPEKYVSQENHISFDHDATTQPETLITEAETSNENFMAHVDHANTQVNSGSHMNTQTTMSPEDYFRIQHIPKLSPGKVRIKQEQRVSHLAYNPTRTESLNWKNMDITYIRETPENPNNFKFPKSKTEFNETMARLDEKFNPIVKLREAKEEVLASNVNDLFKRER